MPENIGFTGTRKGMTTQQAWVLSRMLTDCADRESWFHHGDCLGADAQAHDIAMYLGFKTALHPPISRNMRAFCKADVIEAPKRYLERDRVIAERSDRMVATPSGFNEDLRSGTWYTIRYARKLGRPLTIIYPDGTTGN